MRYRFAAWVSCCLPVLLGTTAIPVHAVEIIKTIDRKFPVGKYCPLESRASAGVNLSFTAPASSVRVTFSANNESSGSWNELHLDNITVVLKSIFDAHQIPGSPGFTDCYVGAGFGNVPAYNFNAGATPEVLLDVFTSTNEGWSGTHAGFDAAANRRAPTNPATGTGLTGGSLAVGNVAGAYVASASKIVSGLMAGQQYVIFAWVYTKDIVPLTIRIGVPCPDLDDDGFVVCGACDPAAGETCGDCDDTREHCSTNCTDLDGDDWCVGFDCSDSLPSCTNDCVTDADTDGTPDCRDMCADPDHDGYGTAGAAGNSCSGSDCSESLVYCNVSCTDTDGDGHCVPGDCQDKNPGVANRLPEINDCSDQQCPGDDGHGVIDETSGNSGFLTAGDKNKYSWPDQTGATTYMAVRSPSPTFSSGCSSTTTVSPVWSEGTVAPPVGSAFFYLNRPLAPCRGSWGQRSTGVERAVICGIESNCGNGSDDDGDASTDCADADCVGTAPCRVQTFAFTDSPGNDISTTALAQFLQTATASATDYISFELVEGPMRTAAWCSVNAAFYRNQYLALAPSQGSVSSGNWNKWRKSPATGNAWTGPDTVARLNTYGNDCFGDHSWCSEQWSPEPRNAIFPDRINDCEAYDLATGACGASVGGTWQLSIKIASTRFLACGF